MSLQGMNVIDASEGIAGPYCAKLLGLYGANVIKVESKDGDYARREGRKLNPSIDANAAYLYLNDNKKGVTLNLNTNMGKEIFAKFAEWADVIIESAAPGYLDDLGLGYKKLSDVNPKLIVTSVTSFGQESPYKDYRTNEMMLSALGGLMIMTGEPDREPLSVEIPRIQMLSGLYAYVATIAAFYAGSVKNKGVHIDVPIVDSVISCLQNATTIHSYSGFTWKRIGNHRPGAYPITTLKCMDGYVTVVAHDQIRWKALCKMLNRPELIEDPRFVTSPKRAANYKELDEYLRPWFAGKKKFEIFEAGQRSGVGMGVIATPKDILEMSQHNARQFFVNIDHKQLGSLKYPGLPFKMNGLNDVQIAPSPGEHNKEVYKNILGFTEEEINVLWQTDVI
jgi:CoA:oxalate CoA-transferase